MAFSSIDGAVSNHSSPRQSLLFFFTDGQLNSPKKLKDIQRDVILMDSRATAFCKLITKVSSGHNACFVAFRPGRSRGFLFIAFRDSIGSTKGGKTKSHHAEGLLPVNGCSTHPHVHPFQPSPLISLSNRPSGQYRVLWQIGEV